MREGGREGEQSKGSRADEREEESHPKRASLAIISKFNYEISQSFKFIPYTPYILGGPTQTFSGLERSLLSEPGVASILAMWKEDASQNAPASGQPLSAGQGHGQGHGGGSTPQPLSALNKGSGGSGDVDDGVGGGGLLGSQF